MGGLDIRDMRLFNLALIGCQVCYHQNISMMVIFSMPKGLIKPLLLGRVLLLLRRLSRMVSVGKLEMVVVLISGLILGVGHKFLPTNVKIVSIRNSFDQGCPSYEVVAETLIHALKYYPILHEVLSIFGWDISTMSRKYDCCIDWLEDMMRAFDKRAMADLMTTLCNCWNSRNNFVFKGKEGKGQILWERASNLSKDFHIYNILNEHLLSQNEAIKKWEKPPKGIVKINFDASINLNRMGYGVIIQDDDGFVLGGGGGFIDKRVLVHEVECIAFERSIKLTCQLNCYW
ncbi:hypothetical protein Godav_013376 [Gossypium davidsonii]|nr:hypothetical protein [Gossypium davidsonii]